MYFIDALTSLGTNDVRFNGVYDALLFFLNNYLKNGVYVA